MGDINTCLKRTFTVFNIIFAVIGAAIILLAVLAQVLTSVHGAEDLEDRITGLILLYVVGAITMVIAVVGAITMVIAVLGAYGAHKEKKGPLIAFLVCMVIGSMMMLRAGITTALARPQMESKLDAAFRKFVPLDEASPEIQKMANSLQSQMHCCGLFSYDDWRNNIPDSCQCNPVEEEGECRSVGYEQVFTPNKSIYAKTCFPILVHYVLLITNVLLVTLFTLGALALLGLGLSSLMIHQLRHPNRPPVMLTVPIFTPQPPKYQELQNPPNYPGY